MRHIHITYGHGISTERPDDWYIKDWHNKVTQIVATTDPDIQLYAKGITWEQFNHDTKLHPFLDLIGDIAAIRDRDVRDHFVDQLTNVGDYDEYWFITHSLGTVLGLQALHALPPTNGKVFRFITVGSPIDRLARMGLLSRLVSTKPPCVTDWVNIHGFLDIVCMVSATGTTGYVPAATLNLHTWTRHSALAYRKTKAFQRAISMFCKRKPG